MRYFDCNATQPLLPEAKEAYWEAEDTHWQNPSSPYRLGMQVASRLDACRRRIQQVLDLPEHSIIFCSGATEANHAAIDYLGRGATPERPLIVNPVEHPSVAKSVDRLNPASCCYLSTHKGGAVSWDSFRASVEHIRPHALSLQAANSETGVIHEFDPIVDYAAREQWLTHMDVSQYLGRYGSHSRFRSVDLLTASAHKFGGPKGLGWMAISGRCQDISWNPGGGQEENHRSGTQNYPGIEAMTVALETTFARMDSAAIERREEWKEQFECRLMTSIPGLRVLGEQEKRLWNTSFLKLPLEESLRWILKLEKKGFIVGTGSACSSMNATHSPLKKALGLTPLEGRRLLRVSSHWDHREADWLALADALMACYQELKNEGDGGMGSAVIQLD